jgi:hypothetical protein
VSFQNARFQRDEMCFEEDDPRSWSGPILMISPKCHPEINRREWDWGCRGTGFSSSVFRRSNYAQGQQSLEKKVEAALSKDPIIEHFTESGSLKGRPEIIWPYAISFKMSMRTRTIPLKRLTALVNSWRRKESREQWFAKINLMKSR